MGDCATLVSGLPALAPGGAAGRQPRGGGTPLHLQAQDQHRLPRQDQATADQEPVIIQL